MSDVLITPASKKIEFKDSSSNIDGKIELDGNDNLVLTSANDLVLGDGSTDLHIGDGTNSIDMVFDQAGRIYGAANKDITLGKSSVGGNDIIVDSPNWSVTAAGVASFASFSGSQTFSGSNEVTLSVDSSHATGSQISLDAQGTGGDEWRIVSGANSAGIGGGSFGLYNIDESAYRFMVTSGGSVGINTTSPAGTIEIVGVGNAAGIIYLKDGNMTADGDGLYIAKDQLDAQIFNRDSGSFKMGTNDSLFFYMKGGKIGIGEDDPANLLEIRGATTTGTKSGHIMLTGDSSTVGQGPQIVFSESGSGSSWAGASIGHARTGSGSMGDLILSTRQSAGDADTVPTEQVRLVGGTSPKITIATPIDSTSATSWNLWHKAVFFNHTYGSAAGQGAGLHVRQDVDTDGDFNSFLMPFNGKLRAIVVHTFGVDISADDTDMTWRVFKNGNASNVIYTTSGVAGNAMTNTTGTHFWKAFTGFTPADTMDQGDTISMRRETGGVNIGSVKIEIFYSAEGY